MKLRDFPLSDDVVLRYQQLSATSINGDVISADVVSAIQNVALKIGLASFKERNF